MKHARCSPSWFSIGLLATLLVSGGCGGGGGGGGSAGATASGSILFLDPSGAVVEAEPNDSPDQPHDLGDLVAGGTRTIVGQTSETPPDPDEFAFEAGELLDIDLTLTFDGANDFDLLVYDPLAQDFPFVFDSTSMPEVGSFQWMGPFHLVVVAFAGAGSYTLEVEATAARIGGEQRSAGPQRIGSLARGAGVRLGGRGGVLPQRSILVSPSRAAFTCTLTGDPSARLVLSDATEDELAPRALEQGGVGTTTIHADPLELVALEVHATAPWTLDVRALDPEPDSQAFVRTRARRARAPSGKLARLAEPAHLGAIALPFVAGELLVRAGTSERAEFTRVLGFYGAREIERIPGGAARVHVALPAGLEDEHDDEALGATVALRAALATDRLFDYVEPNFVRQALQVPDDPFYNLQWHYPLIQLPAAWDVTVGDANTIVCVIDTGSTDHPDLVARQIGGFDMIANTTVAADGDGRDADPTDVGDGQGLQPSSFHGTHVAGTIGASSDNGSGVTGVTWAGRIEHVRVLGKGGGTDFDIANGILYAARLANASGELPAERADVINMSLGGAGFSQTSQDACTAAHDAGVVVVAAAGNNNSPNFFYPASNEDVISVAAVDLDSHRAPYSNFNARVDIAAPGGDTSVDRNGDGYADGVLSTLVDDTANPDEFVYVFYQGTSMASPHVAGVAALVLAANPALTPDQVETTLTSTATDLGAAGRDDQFGHGLVNAFAAVTAAAGAGSTEPVLGLSTLALALNPGLDTAVVQVSNVGGDVLDVTNVVAMTESGGAWLTAQPVAGTSKTTNVTSIDVAVDRSGLADGVYAGSIAVQSSGGDATINVSLVVATTPPVQDVELFVLAVDIATFETRAQDVVNPAAILDYSLLGLPAGDYLLVAGSDDDEDGFICGPGDRYCGFYPTLDQPQLVTVVAGEALAGLDFTVSTQSSVTSAGVPVRGFALRD